MQILLLSCVVAALVIIAFLSTPAMAQVPPQQISYQGRMAVGTTNFTGTGLFKFALVNGSGSATYWSTSGTVAHD